MTTEDDQQRTGFSETDPSSDAPTGQNGAQTPKEPASHEPSQSEVAHVLFMDIVGFTRLPTDKQTQALKNLLEIVRSTEEYTRTLAQDRLLRLPTGDGMALVFFSENPIVPVRCAQQICGALRSRDHGFGLRMGIHSGPIYRVENIDNRPNVAGDGINIAQRVMDCGDSGHILLSNAVADYLKSFDEWAGQIQDFKQVRVKNRKRVHVFNLSNRSVGNRKLPGKIRKHRLRRMLLVGGVGLLAAAIIVFGVLYLTAAKKREVESVAILPLLKANSETNYLCASIARDVNIKLRSVPKDFDVQPDPGITIENNSRWADPLEAGRLFNAQAVVYVANENRDSIDVRIMDARTNTVIHSHQYDLKGYGVKGIAGQISLDILNKLSRSGSQETLTQVAKPNTKSNRAYELVSKGRAALDKRTGDEIEAGINLLKQAIEEDPSYADAYASLAMAYNIRGGYTNTTPQENYPLAKRAAHEALGLDPTLVEAHYALGYSLSNYDYQWAESQQEFSQAINLDPKSGTARYYYGFNYLISQGMMEQAVSEMEQAQRLAPESLIISTNLGWTYYYAGDYKRAVDQYKTILAREPRFERAHFRLIEAYEQMGKIDEAVAQWQAWANLASEEKESNKRKLFVQTIQEGNAKNNVKVYWQNYLKAREQQASDPANGPIPPYVKASIYAMLGRKADALALLRRAYDLRDESAIKMAVNPRFASLRSEKEFIQLVNRIGLKFPPKPLAT